MSVDSTKHEQSNEIMALAMMRAAIANQNKLSEVAKTSPIDITRNPMLKSKETAVYENQKKHVLTLNELSKIAEETILNLSQVENIESSEIVVEPIQSDVSVEPVQFDFVEEPSDTAKEHKLRNSSLKVSRVTNVNCGKETVDDIVHVANLLEMPKNEKQKMETSQKNILKKDKDIQLGNDNQKNSERKIVKIILEKVDDPLLNHNNSASNKTSNNENNKTDSKSIVINSITVSKCKDQNSVVLNSGNVDRNCVTENEDASNQENLNTTSSTLYREDVEEELIDHFQLHGDENVEKTENLAQCESLEIVEDLIRQHEEQCNVKFSLYYCGKDFGKTDIYLEKHKVYWQHDIDTNYFIPYVFLNSRVYDCCYGKDRNAVVKEKKRKRHHMFFNHTKKVNCPATLKIKEICIFPQYKLCSLKKRAKDGYGKIVKERIQQRDPTLEYVKKFLLSLPEPTDHKFHTIGLTNEQLKEEGELHPFLIERIEQLVKKGNTKVFHIKKLLKTAVEKEMFPGPLSPRPCNKKYYPLVKTIRKYVELFQESLEINEPDGKREKKTDASIRTDDEDECLSEEIDDDDESNEEAVSCEVELTTESLDVNNAVSSNDTSVVSVDSCREKLRQIYELISMFENDSQTLGELHQVFDEIEKSLVNRVS